MTIATVESIQHDALKALTFPAGPHIRGEQETSWRGPNKCVPENFLHHVPINYYLSLEMSTGIKKRKGVKTLNN